MFMRNQIILFLTCLSIFSSAVHAEKTDDISDIRGSITDLPDDSDFLEQITQEWGPILKPDDHPALHDMLAKLFSELSFAQGRLTEGAAATVNYVHIINSEELNAFVWTDNKVGVRLFANHLFITTEMIRVMMDQGSIEEGLSRLAGVISHELGHPMDKTSAYGGEGGIAIDNHYGAEASQAVEIRADIDGMRILREANYPIDSLYRSLVRLFGKEKSSASLVGSLASSHPHHEFRLSSARLFLTLDRLENGTLTKPRAFTDVIASADKFNSELQAVLPKNGRYPYAVPKSFEEITRRLSALRLDKHISDQFRSLEFNRLVLSFDHMLWQKQKTGQELTREDRTHFANFINTVFEATSPQDSFESKSLEIFDAEHIRKKINKASGASGLENSPSHYYFLERLSAYNLPEVEHLLKTQAVLTLSQERLFDPYDTDASRQLVAAANVSSSNLFFAQFGDDLKNNAKTLWLVRGAANYSFRERPEKFKSFDFHFQAKFAQLLAPLRTAIEIAPFSLSLFSESLDDQWVPIPLSSEITEKNNSLIIKKYRQALVYLRSGRHPELQADVDTIRKICTDVWELRGFYGTLEILFEKDLMDWATIIEVLNLHKNVAYNQIDSEVQKYMQGERQYRNAPAYKTLLLVPASQKLEISGRGLERWLVWNGRNLKRSVLGQGQNIEFNDRENTGARKLFATYRVKQKKIFIPEYRNAFSETLKRTDYKSPVDFIFQLATTHHEFLDEGASRRELNEITEWNKIFFLKTQLELIRESTRPLAETQLWFESIFTKRVTWHLPARQKSWEEFYSNLHSANFPSISYLKQQELLDLFYTVYRKLYHREPVDFFIELKKFSTQENISDSDFYQALDASEKYLQQDLKQRKFARFEDLDQVIQMMKPIAHRKAIYEKSLNEAEFTELEYLADSESVQMNSARIQRLKKTILTLAETLVLSREQKLKMFLDLTESGATKDTDKLFRSLVDINAMDPKQYAEVLNYLGEGRFNSDKLKLDLAKIFVGKRVKRLKAEIIEKGQKVDRYTLNKLVKDLNRFTPNGSMAKDDFLESIGWSLHLRGSELDGFIDDQKSQNWRRANPLLIRVGSLLASQISSMSYQNRLNTIEYLLDPVNKETTLFNDIFEELKKITYNDLLKNASGILTPAKLRVIKANADRIAEVLKLKAEEAIRDSSATERIPLFEVVLSAGTDAPIHKKDWPVNISRRYLSYPADSVEESLFTTLLEVFPKHESATAVAYALSLLNEEGDGNSARLFEVFGAVGKKFGQLVSVWKIFGDQIAADAAHLKNRAKPLDRYEVISLANSRHHEVQAIVEEFEKVLGSASIKTTARVRFTDGSKGVIALQGKHVEEIIHMNLDLGKKYLERLKQKGVIKNSKFMMNLIEALEEQIITEIDMKNEALKTKQAGKILAEISREMKDDLKGWQIRVPQVLENKPLTREMAFYELAKSVSYDELSTPELKQEVGRIIAKANLKSLFKYGWFDPDRHTGNFLIDPETKTIYFLDFGQYENFAKSVNPFTMDPRLVIGQFIKSLSDMDSKNVIHYAQLMARPNGGNIVHTDALQNNLDRLFADARKKGTPDIKELMIDVINDIAESGLKFDTRYIFGGLKGLIILYGENYVEAKEFETLLRGELTSLFKLKFPAIIKESWKGSPTEDSKQRKILRCQEALRVMGSNLGVSH